MLHLEQFCKTYDRVEWSTDLEAHIVEEGILHHLYLLGAERLLGQFLLDTLQFADVTAHAEILFHPAGFVVIGDEVELQMDSLIVLPADRCLDVGMNVARRLVVHVVEDALHLLLVLIIHEVENTRLCQGRLNAIGLAEDVQHVGFWIVFHDAQAADGKHIVDIPDVSANLVVCLLQLFHVLLQCLIGVGDFCDVSSRTVESEQFAFGVVDGHNLQLVVQFLALQDLVQQTWVVGRFEKLGDIQVVHVLKVEVLDAEHILDVEFPGSQLLNGHA